MLSALSSYIWGEEVENQATVDIEACDGDADWIFVEKKGKASSGSKSNRRDKGKGGQRGATVDFDLDNMELIGLAAMYESWYVTPPACFTNKKRDGYQPLGDLHASQFENLLIEHPSMSVYGQPTSDAEEQMDQDPVVNDNAKSSGTVRQGGKLSGTDAARLQIFSSRKPLQELKESVNCIENINKKVAKRSNLVHNRSRSQHKKRVRTRADGRRAVQIGKRGG